MRLELGPELGRELVGSRHEGTEVVELLLFQGLSGPDALQEWTRHRLGGPGDDPEQEAGFGCEAFEEEVHGAGHHLARGMVRAVIRCQGGETVAGGEDHPGAGAGEVLREVLQEAVPLGVGAGVDVVASDGLELGLEVVQHQEEALGLEGFQEVVAEVLVAGLALDGLAGRQEDRTVRVAVAGVPVGLAVEREALVEDGQTLTDRMTRCWSRWERP